MRMQPPVPLQMETPAVDDINPLRTLNCGNYGIFLIMGSVGFISSTVATAGRPTFVEEKVRLQKVG